MTSHGPFWVSDIFPITTDQIKIDSPGGTYTFDGKELPNRLISSLTFLAQVMIRGDLTWTWPRGATLTLTFYRTKSTCLDATWQECYDGDWMLALRPLLAELGIKNKKTTLGSLTWPLKSPVDLGYQSFYFTYLTNSFQYIWHSVTFCNGYLMTLKTK